MTAWLGTTVPADPATPGAPAPEPLVNRIAGYKRFGVKLSFNRGRLPPVYAEVRSFTFGFVIESGGDDAKTPSAPSK